MPLEIKCCFPPHPCSLPSFWSKWGNVCQHMSPSVNKHFQYAENNILALGLLHQDVMNTVHLSQPPALFLAAERLSQPNNYSPPQHQRRRSWRLQMKTVSLWAFFSILTSQYKSSTMNPLPPLVPLAFSYLPKITQSQLKSLLGRNCLMSVSTQKTCLVIILFGAQMLRPDARAHTISLNCESLRTINYPL